MFVVSKNKFFNIFSIVCFLVIILSSVTVFSNENILNSNNIYKGVTDAQSIKDLKTEHNVGKEVYIYNQIYNTQSYSSISYPVFSNEAIDSHIKGVIDSITWDYNYIFAYIDNIDLDLYINYDSYEYTNSNNRNFITVLLRETILLNNDISSEKIHILTFDKDTGVFLSTKDGIYNMFTYNKACIFVERIKDYVYNYLFSETDYINDKVNNYKDVYLNQDLNYNISFTGDGIYIIFDGGLIAPMEYGVTKIKMTNQELSNILPDDFYETDYIINRLASQRIIDKNKKMVAITYDDGPEPTYTNMILDTLDKYNVVATFYDIGELVDKYPEVVSREYYLGCEIGNHSYYHDKYTELTAEEIREDIRKTNQAFVNAVGFVPLTFRPPYGASNDTVLNNVNMYNIHWSVDTKDWSSQDANAIMDTIYNAGNLDGQVILMHGIYESTALATEILIPYLLGNDYQLVTVTELMNNYYGGYTGSNKLYGYTFFDEKNKII